ncbi:MAG: hypothetical protein JXR76_28675 [Deltaproteobacteria bacterium]|nr:hypothetical protein [Deltaproteobacteria bacterium]
MYPNVSESTDSIPGKKKSKKASNQQANRRSRKDDPADASTRPDAGAGLSGCIEFRKVDEFFSDMDSHPEQWNKLCQFQGIAITKSNDENQTNDRLLLTLKDTAGTSRYMAVDFITADIFRIKFNPAQKDGNYSDSNTRSTVQDNYGDLRRSIEYYANSFPQELGYTAYTSFSIEKQTDTPELFSCTTTSDKDILQIEFNKSNLTVSVYRVDTKERVWSANLNNTWFKHQITYNSPVGQNETVTDYAVSVSINSPDSAKYIGFGEKGGNELCKNGKQLSYFNFDNMRYQSIYQDAGNGALDTREPLYHSNPFFVEFNGTPDTPKGVLGTFVNNPSQILMDVCCTHKDQLRVATTYGEMDIVVFVGDTSKEVLSKSTSISGKARLKPRYALGYHQGGYGYEDTQSMLDVVNGYGDSDVPFDGLHVDVDVQTHYRTFTMNENKYRRICMGRDGKAGPIDTVNANNVVLLQRRDSSGNQIEAVQSDGTPVLAQWINGELIECNDDNNELKPLKNQDGTNKKVGRFLFEHLLDGHHTWAADKDMKIKCSTNITPVVSNPYVMENQNDGETYRTFKSGLDGDFFVKYQKAMPDMPENKATYNGSDYNGTYLGGVYYGQDAEKKELGSFGHYPDFGKKDTRLWWGLQYKELLKAGLSMIWQDMTTPAISINQNIQYRDESWFNFTLWNGAKNISKGDDHANMCCSFKSFPFYLFLSDNFDKRYCSSAEADKKSPAGIIRNLYSYNLHKATWHGINNIWKINEMSFTWVIFQDQANKALNKDQSKEVLGLLVNRGTILEPTANEGSVSCYTVTDPDSITREVQAALAGSAYATVADQVCQVLYDSRTLEKRANQRNFIVGRGGFSGMHRFAALWTGDNASTWDFLKINVAQMLALGMSGQPMAGADIGGFENPQNCSNKWADPELVMRWTILGAFLPWFRNHYRRKGTKEFQELYKFQDFANAAPENERFLYHSILPVSRMYIKLRYQMLQLFYDAMFENTVTGMPIARPLFLQDEQDKRLFGDRVTSLNDQFLVGKDFMVAPIMDKQTDRGHGTFEAKRSIYYPAGSNWYQFLHNKKPLTPSVTGGQTCDYNAPIDSRCCAPDADQSLYVLPLYVREGGILPMTESERYVGAYYDDHGESMPITVNVYPSPNQKDTSYSMYLDDGKSRSAAHKIDVTHGGDPAAKGEYRKVFITHSSDADWNRTITIKREHDGVDQNQYRFCKHSFVALPHDPAEPIVTQNSAGKDSICEVKVNGQKIPFYAATANGTDINNHFNAASQNMWYFNTALNTSYIKVFDEAELTVTFRKK